MVRKLFCRLLSHKTQMDLQRRAERTREDLTVLMAERTAARARLLRVIGEG